MDEPIIFCGPTQQRGILQRGQIFVSEAKFPRGVQRLLEAQPVLRSFFCPISQYSTFQARMGLPLEHSLKRSRTALMPKRVRKGLLR